MKYPEIKINITEPCHEDWNKMTPTEKGKFCNVCTKEVIDFTSKSNEEIVKYVIANQNICGKLLSTQLDQKLVVARKKRNHWLSYAASLLFPIALISQEVKKETQNIPKTEQTNASVFTSLNIGSLHKQGKIALSVKNDSITVKGVITDEDGLPLPGASIKIKNTAKDTSSDFDGNFTINVKREDILVINYVGFESKEIKVNSESQNFDIQLNSSVIGSIAIIPYQGAAYKHIICTTTVSSDQLTEKKDSKEKEQRTKNYFAFQRKKWLEKREKRRAERAKRKAEKAAKKDNSNI